MAAVDRLGWAATIPLRTGGYVLGARVNSHTVAEVVRQLFADRVAEPADPPSNLSLELAVAAHDDATGRRLHRLYRGCTLEQRTRDPVRALGALWHELHGHDLRWARTDLLLDATVLVEDGRANILPASVREHVVGDLRRWESHGLRLWDARWVILDLMAGEVVLSPPPFAEARVDIEAHVRNLGMEVPASDMSEGGRVPIISWTVARSARSPAERLMRAVGQILDRPDRLDADDVRRLGALLVETDDLGPEWTSWATLRAALESLR